MDYRMILIVCPMQYIRSAGTIDGCISSGCHHIRDRIFLRVYDHITGAIDGFQDLMKNSFSTI